MKAISMERIQIDIINPKAKSLLLALVELNLIKISEPDSKTDFVEVIESLRKNSGYTPTPKEIASEVSEVRKKRYK